MGNQLKTISQWNYLHELPEYTIMEKMEGSRLFKAMKMVDENTGLLYVKIFPKNTKLPEYEDYENRLKKIKSNIYSLHVSNLLPFTKFIETQRAGYLFRPYLFSNMRDRLSTRPFLTILEKKWILYQLILGLRDAESVGISHGDIKPENILITSFMWVYLTDWAFYKPRFLPQDNPSDFSYFFDISGRRTCYIAPERFYTQQETEKLQEKYDKIDIKDDIFSLGCVAAELFLDGNPLFHLSDILRYKKGEFDPNQKIETIPDPNIRNFILSAISLDPNKRKTPSEYLREYEKNLFPHYFKFIYPLFWEMLFLLPDQKIEKIQQNYNLIFNHINNFQENFEIISRNRKNKDKIIEEPINQYINKSNQNTTKIKSSIETEKMFQNVSNFSKKLKFNLNQKEKTEQIEQEKEFLSQKTNPENTINQSILTNCRCYKKLSKSFQNSKDEQNLILSFYSTLRHNRHEKKTKPKNRKQEDGFILVLNMVCATIRNCYKPLTKITGLHLFRTLSENISDFIKIERVVPYIINMINDPYTMVRAEALKVLTDVLVQVESVSVSDYQLFPEYILHSLDQLILDSDPIVRVVYAKLISKLCLIANRFLESSFKLLEEMKKHQIKTVIEEKYKNNLSSLKNSKNLSQLLDQINPSNWEDLLNDIDFEDIFHYDKEYNILRQEFLAQIIHLFNDENPNVKRELIKNIGDFGIFFGTKIIKEKILPIMISILNEDDWLLRSEFFTHILDLLPFVNKETIQKILFPCLINCFDDPEEFVVQKLIHLMAILVELSLLSEDNILRVAEKAFPLLIHPSVWIMKSTVSLCVSIANNFGPTKTHIFIKPILNFYLNSPLFQFDEKGILAVLKPRIPRYLYESVVDQTHRTNAVNLLEMEFESNFMKIELDADKVNKKQMVEAVHDEFLQLQLEETQKSTEKFSFNSQEISEHDLILSRIFEEQQKLLKLKDFIKKASLNLERRRESYGLEFANMIADDLDEGNVKNLDDSFHSLKYSPIIQKIIKKIQQKKQKKQKNINEKSKNDIFDIELPPNIPSYTSQDMKPRFQSDNYLLYNSQFLPYNSSSNNINKLRMEITNASVVWQQMFGISIDDEIFQLQQKNESNYQQKYVQNQNNQLQKSPSNPTTPTSRSLGPHSPQKHIQEDLANFNSGGFSAPNSPSFPQTENFFENKFSFNINDRKLVDLIYSSLDDFENTRKNHNFINSQKYAPIQTKFSPETQQVIKTKIRKFRNSKKKFSKKKFGESHKKRGLSNPISKFTNNKKQWKPKGSLIAQLTEHNGAVNKIIVSNDFLFFATGSDDGSVKIWRTEDLRDKKLSQSSSTYTLQKGRISSLFMLQNTYTIASGSNNGSIHLFRFDILNDDFQKEKNSPVLENKKLGKNNNLNAKPNFSKLTRSQTEFSPIRQEFSNVQKSQMEEFPNFVLKILSPNEGKIVGIDNWGTNSGSFIYATQNNVCHVHDMRCDQELFNFEIEKKLGFITSIASEPNSNWCSIGTSTGFIQCFDLRFLIPFQTWREPSYNPIETLKYYSSNDHDFWIVSSSLYNNEICVWDIETSKCRKIFRVLPSRSRSDTFVQSKFDYLSYSINDGLENIFFKDDSDTSFISEEIKGYFLSNQEDSIHSIHSIWCSPDEPYLITGGSDLCLRYWNTENIENSFIISGNDDEKREEIEYRYQQNDKIDIYWEYSVSPLISQRKNQNLENIQKKKIQTSHKDTITDINMLRLSSPLMISSSRDGVVNVWI
ncbi:phosphoinositide 3-kinase regulatory subunit 4 [Anaeramoeba ignava]|uniref:non-specific serine/threonine protein kinase n=1 Tax=Anaeramoeba ignava TaxID=1746090 RepID=A0A9Q0LGP4_ANAIG|nr:phosphoinositide 3-kinase regulatory subunit 4 [Anaeramoeba ignava]